MCAEEIPSAPKFVSNWILMSRQLHRVTSGQSNLGHKQMHISKLFSYICINHNPQNQSLRKLNIKRVYTNTSSHVHQKLRAKSISQ